MYQTKAAIGRMLRTLPVQTAMPAGITASPTYIGLLDSEYAPEVTRRVAFFGCVGWARCPQ
jgi:hypothetical protein